MNETEKFFTVKAVFRNELLNDTRMMEVFQIPYAKFGLKRTLYMQSTPKGAFSAGEMEDKIIYQMLADYRPFSLMSFEGFMEKYEVQNVSNAGEVMYQIFEEDGEGDYRIALTIHYEYDCDCD